MFRRQLRAKWRTTDKQWGPASCVVWCCWVQGKGEFPYLRVTLGAELGDGPGIPYVLEIWPGAALPPAAIVVGAVCVLCGYHFYKPVCLS